MIEFHCDCGNAIRVPKSLAHRDGACPQCGRLVRVPTTRESLIEEIVDIGKHPIVMFTRPGDPEELDVQARTYIPGYIYVLVVFAIVGWIGRNRSSFFEVIGLSGDVASWTQYVRHVTWALVTALAAMSVRPTASAIYFRFTGKRRDEDRRAFADAGGLDIVRWAPLASLLALYGVYWQTLRAPQADPLASIRDPWFFTLIGAAAAHALVLLAGRTLWRARFGKSGAADALIEALAAGQDLIRLDAAARLGKLKEPRAVGPLINALGDENDQVRWAAAGALGKIGDPHARAALAKALDDRKESVRWEARAALRKLDKANRLAPRPSRSKPRRPSVRWEKVSIFVSSTFNDMHSERDYLVKRVFPQLRDWCERRRLRLVDIDLRWGVTEQDATRNRNVVNVCLNRIDECRPFFVCLLGQRRGWVPKEEEVSPETFHAFPELSRFVGEASVTEIEILHALISPLHGSGRDPTRAGNYYESAQHVFFYLRDPSYLSTLPAEPAQLRQLFTNEWLEDSVERARHDKAVESWRERQIPGLGRPVHSYRATWDAQATTPELMLPLDCPAVEEANIERWRKQWAAAGVRVAGLDIENDPREAEKARAFNRRLCAGRLTGFQSEGTALSDVMIKDLQGAITERYPDHCEIAAENELQTELDGQERFLAASSEGFIERDGDFIDLDRYIASDSDKLFVLSGPGGMGKSMLLANWVESYRARVEYSEDERIYFRFIGASDQSNDVDSLLRLLLLEMREAGSFDQQIPDDPMRLRNALPEMLRTSGQHGKTIIVIDGLNQLETGLQDLSWLRSPLPYNLKMIVSFKNDTPEGEEFHRRCANDEGIILSEVAPFDRFQDRRKLVTAYLSEYLKELDERNLEELITSEGAENPLYLKVVLSELRIFGAFANLHERIRSAFGRTPVSAFEGLLRRLEADPVYTTLDARAVISLIFGLLSHARRSLSVDELVDVIAANYPWPGDSDHRAGLGCEGSTQLKREQARDAVNLYLRQLRPFIAGRGRRYGFFYESFKLAAIKRYEGESSSSDPMKRPAQGWHQLLANYFQGQPLYLDEDDNRGGPERPNRKPNLRKVDELPWQQTMSGMWSELEQTLCDLDFIEAKCLAGNTDDLVQDYAAAERAWPQSRGAASDLAAAEFARAPHRVRLFAQFVSSHAHILRRDATQVIPFARNYASEGPVAERATRLLEGRGWQHDPWIELADRPPLIVNAALLRTLEGHQGSVNGVALSADGRIALSGSSDGTIRVWDATSGQLLRAIDAHGGGVNDVSITADGSFAATAGADGIVRIWNVRSGRCLNSLPGHQGEVTSVALTDSGGVVSGGRDGTVRVCSLTDGRLVTVLKGHFGPVNDVAVTPDGRMAASAGWDCSIRLWDLNEDKMISCFEGNPVSVQGVGISADGSVVASSSGMSAGASGTAPRGLSESEVKFYTSDGACLFAGREHRVENRGGWKTGVLGSAVYDIALNRDGRTAVSVGYDRAVCVWDVAGRRARRRLTGHLDAVLSVAADDSGTVAVTGGADRTVRVWWLAGESPAPMPAIRRIGRIGKAARTSFEEKAALLLMNRRVLNWIIIPISSLVLAYGVAAARYIFSGETPRVGPLEFGLSALVTMMFIRWLRWGRSLRADPYVWKSGVLPRSFRIILSLLLLPLIPFFGVFDCPCCGHRVCGRRTLFHCAHCGWGDKLSLR